jgi:preprotein translocase subunit YajC
VEAIFSRLVGLSVLFGEGAPAAGGPAAGDGQSMLVGLLPFVAIFVLFYFLLIRPQRREQARRQEMLSAVKKNDRVITAGGIYGVVTNVHREADEVTIKVDEATNTKLRVTLSSIARIMGDEPSEDSASK